MIQIGKVPNNILKEQIFNHLSFKREEVIVYPNIGEDCGVLEFEENTQIVLSTDPITGAIHNIGKLAVHISCNDISSAGAEPVGVLVTLLLPVGTKEEDIHSIMKDIHDTAAKQQVVILGGHSEVTDAVIRPVISTTVIGKVKKGKLVCTQGAQVGDEVILTKWAGLEGTAILASDFEESLEKVVSKEALKEAKTLADQLSVFEESKLAQVFPVTSMHDVTEGGVLGGCYEIAKCSDKGINVYLESIPVLPCTKEICNYFAISPYKLISSGCMLMTTPKGRDCIKWLQEKNIPATIIGKITEHKKLIIEKEHAYPLEAPGSDELYKIARIKS